MIDFKDTWARIRAHAGEEFQTVRGLPFSYRVEGLTLTTTRTEFPLTRSDFEKAHSRMPLTGPGEITRLVRGPSYIFAILTDKRTSV